MASSTSSSQTNVEEDALNAIGHQGFSQTPKIFHVFINHRGPDVKQTLALQLYNSLENAGIRAFLDTKEMELGDFIPASIRTAIFSASVQIAIFSKGYAESVWCLEELDLMLQSKAKIIPVFYDVAPSALRYLEKGVYADSFTKYKAKGRHLDKLDTWKQTLRSVSFISGYEFSHHNRDVEKLCKKVVSAVLREVEKTRILETAKNPVGINDLVKDFERSCFKKMESKEKIVGIYGMGGSGKTTLAKELFNRKRLKYNSSCFLFDVREASANSNLTSLQSKLLKDLLHEERRFHSIPEGSSYLRSCLRSCPYVKFLIFIDDIDHVDQLNAFLVRDIVQNNFDNLIIVTARDERVLIRAGITHRYKMKEMNVSHSTELFCWHAFQQPYPACGYEDLVEMFVKECGGLPLSLQVLGGHVFGSNSQHYWKLELDKVRKTLHQDIKQTFRISIDALDTEQKEILMDIACFFINKSSHMAIRIWEGSGWSGEHTIQTLKDKCLIEVQLGKTYWNGYDSGNIPLLGMHDHIRDLARQMADEVSSPRRLWRPQYLRALEANGFQCILEGTPGYSFRCLNSIFDRNTSFEYKYFLIVNSNDCDEPSTSLLWLEIDLSLCEMLDELESVEEHMKSVPSPCTIPCWIPLQNLQYLKVSNGRLRKLWDDNEQAPFQLRELVLDGTNLEEFPNSLGKLSYLEDLVLKGRAEWNGLEWNNSMQIEGRSFSESLEKLTNLRSLVLRDLTVSGELALKVREVSTAPGNSTVNLEKIDIRDVKLISKVSISEEYLHRLKSIHLHSMENLIEVDLAQNSVEGPSKIGWLLSLARLRWIERIVTDGGGKLQKLIGIDKLKRKKYLQNCVKGVRDVKLKPITEGQGIAIDGCWKLQKITGINKLEKLKYLHLSAGIPAISYCTDLWQRPVSQVTSVIWSSSVILDENFFSRVIGPRITLTRMSWDQTAKSYVPGDDGAISYVPCKAVAPLKSEVPSDDRETVEVPLPSAIIICMTVENFYQGKDIRKNLKIPCGDWKLGVIPQGKSMVTVVVRDREKIKKMRNGMSDWIPTVTDGRVTSCFIITIHRKKKELEILRFIEKREQIQSHILQQTEQIQSRILQLGKMEFVRGKKEEMEFRKLIEKQQIMRKKKEMNLLHSIFRIRKF